MTNEVACPVCQKKYAVGPEMAGRKVRCRQCANVFTVAGAQVPAMAGALELEPEEGLSPPPPAPPLILDAQSEFERALNLDVQQPKLRPSTMFKFPWAAQLDEWLPPSLVVVGGVWSIYETFHSDIGPIWAGLLRLLVVFGLYVGVVVPITMIGIRKIALKFKYALPPQPAWRTAAAYALPAMLGYVTWVALVSPASFAIGCLLGLIFAAGAFWFLFRVDPQKELAPSFGAATGAFVGSLVCCGMIMWVLNLVLNGVMQSNHTAGAIKISPIGPSYAWKADVAPPARRGGSDNNDTDVAPLAGPSLARQDSLNANPPAAANLPPINAGLHTPEQNAVAASEQPNKQSTERAAVSVEKTASALVPATQPTDVVAELPKKSNSVFDGIDDDSKPPAPLTRTPDPVVTVQDTKWVADLKARQLPFVTDVSSPKGLDTFDELVYPATTSSYMAVVRHKDSEDAVELRKADTFEVVGTANCPRESGMDMGMRRYALSPDGQYLIFTASFPRPMFQIWSFKEQAVIGHSPMTDNSTMPQLVGFVDNAHFLTLCQIRGFNELQARDVKNGIVVHQIRLPAYERSPGNGQISPDGKEFALATRVRQNGALQAALLVYDPLHAASPSRTRTIKGFSERWPVAPAGIAFTPDSSRVAIMFARPGEAYVIAWERASRDGNPIAEQFCAGVAPPQQQDLANPCSGRLFDWVGNNAWLIGGSSLVDTRTGKLMANLASSPAKGQHCLNGTAWHMEYASDQTHDRLAVVQMDPDKLASSVQK
jgi:hypothetical protein